MEFIHFIIELLTQTKDVLMELFRNYGLYIYAFLFLIIFIETGLVIFPFLPGDSLLFTAGMLCAQPDGLNIWILIPLLILAAVMGDNINYFVGRFFNEKVLSWKYKGKPLVKQAWLDQTHEFFEKNGTKTIILARFVPIVRTVTPFVSGVGKMNYKIYLPYDIFGGFLWVTSVSLLGYFLGQIEFVEKHLEKFILLIIFISVIPIFVGYYKNRVKSK
ncbi:MAG: VTT domain-containing protein [Saprospiraceae bacterium]